MAEIFILLIFLLLLAFLGLTSRQEEELQEREQAKQELEEKERERQRLETILSEWRPVIDEFRTPEEIRTLHRRAAELQQQIDRYEDHLSETGEGRSNVQALLEELRKENMALRAENHTIREVSEQVQGDIDSLSRQMSELQAERDALAQQAETERQAAEKARTDLDIFRKKGQNPPCWYQTVPADEGKTREKPYYTFDIAVYDDAMVVRRREPPPGRAEDDNGPPYVDEALSLGLDRVVYGARLSDTELDRQMRRIHNLGNAGKVRTYACIFWVRVWDKTSADAKARWKQAHDNVLESLFGTYNVKDDPWPG